MFSGYISVTLFCFLPSCEKHQDSEALTRRENSDLGRPNGTVRLPALC